MNIDNEEVLRDIKEKIACSSKLIKFDSQSRNMRTYSQEVIDLANKQLSSLDKPIMVETENGEVYPLLSPRVEYNGFEDNKLMLSIIGDLQIQTSTILELKIDEIYKKET